MSIAVKPCPNCAQPLRIPAMWVGQTMRCKFCGHVMVAYARGQVPAGMTAAGGPAATWEPLPDASLPEYTPSTVTSRNSEPAGDDYQSPYGKRKGRGGRYRGPKSGRFLRIGVYVVLFLMCGAAIAAVMKYLPDAIDRPTSTDQIAKKPTGDSSSNTTTGGNNSTANHGSAGGFPRRMLAISIHSYLYANPLHNGDSGAGLAQDDASRTGTHGSISRLVERWRIPKDQFYHLTDAVKVDKRPIGKKANNAPNNASADSAKIGNAPPLKSVMEGTIERFCATSRAQDRVVFLFCGHVVEKDAQVYLVPLEGDLDEVPSLIPLKWVYEKLEACKAQEKLVIWDVCRFHPQRGIERPHPGPMSDEIEKALHGSPDGVSVLTSCSKGEYAYEVDYQNVERRYQVYGSYFLSYFHAASQDGALSPADKKSLPQPQDIMPMEPMAEYLVKKLPDAIKITGIAGEKSQTPKFTLKRKEGSVQFDATEAMASKVDFPAPPPSADLKTVQSILGEVELPPVKSLRADAPRPKVSDVLPFSEESLKPYLAGNIGSGKPNDFQSSVMAAVKELREMGSGGKRELPETFQGQNSDAAKNQIRESQKVPGELELQLRDVLEKLEEVAEMKETQTKRWQVHYDYVVAQVKFRICYVNQYNLALARVRGEKVPDLQPGQNGYRVASDIKLDETTAKEYKDMFDQAKKSMTEIIKTHANTPWALLAKADRTVAIGLRIVPANLGEGG